MRRFRRLSLAALSAAFFAAAGCSGSDGDGADTVPATPAERAAVVQMKYCFEGAGALTAKPGEQIAQLDRTPSGPDVDGAKRVLVAYWADTGDAAHLYYASDPNSTEEAAKKLSIDGVEWSNGVIVVPDEEDPPSEDEALLASDCLP